MIAKREQRFFQIQYGLLALACLSIPFTIYLLLPIMVLLFINWLIECNFKMKFHRLKENKTLPYLILLVGFFLLYVLGLFYSNNKESAWSNLECKMWFLGISFVILTANPLLLTRERIQKLFYLFLFACFTVATINFIWSLVIYFQTGDSWHIVYTNLTHLLPARPMHPSYLAMYMTFSSFFAYQQLFFHRKELKKGVKVFLWAAIVLFALFIFFLQSKAGILTYYFLLIVSILIFLNLKKKRYLISITTVVFMIVAGSLLLQITPHGRMKAAFTEISEDVESDEGINSDTSPGSSGQRIMAWMNSMEVIKKHPIFGVGTGDVMDELMIEYKNNGLELVYHKRLNAHNQYLQTTMALGIVGLLWLLSLLAYPLYFSIKHKNFLLLFFIAMTGANLLVESMFEVRAGADFIPFFYCLLAFQTKNNVEHSATNTNIKTLQK